MSIGLDNRPLIYVAAVMTAASLLLSVWHGDGMLIGACAAALLITAAAVAVCGSAYAHSVVSSAIVFVCTVLTVILIPADTFVRSGDTEWLHVCASSVLTGLIIVPQIPMLFRVLAAAFKASFNWAVLMSLGWLIGTGLMIPKYLMFAIFQNEAANTGTANAVIIADMLTGILMFTVFSVIMGYVLQKKRCIIAPDGSEAMP